MKTISWISIYFITIINLNAQTEQCGNNSSRSSIRPVGLNESIESSNFIVHYTTTANDPNQTTQTYANSILTGAEEA